MQTDMPVIVMPLVKQTGLDEQTRLRLWHSVRTEILSALSCYATNTRHSRGQLIGFSETWNVVLSKEPSIHLFPRAAGAAIHARHTDAALRSLAKIATTRRDLIGAPRLMALR